MAYGNDKFGDPLAGPLILAQGHYLLVTGNRVPGGKVLSNLTFFELKGGEKKEMMITLRKSGYKIGIGEEIIKNVPMK